MARPWIIFSFLVFTSAFMVPIPGNAEVDRVEVRSRALLANGQAFGLVGSYVRIAGRLHYSVDPASDMNAAIHDLDLAPTDSRGRVTFSGDFVLLMPLDPSRGNGRLLYDVTNRGGMVALHRFNNATGRDGARSKADIGNGFLLEQGYSVLWTGWNWDVVPRAQTLTIDLPVLTALDGEILTGIVTGEIAPVDSKLSARHVGMGSIGYQPLATAVNSARLAVRDAGEITYETVPRDSWTFGRPITAGETETRLNDPTWITLSTGFEPGRVYRLTYTAQNPRVVGLGLAAMRDAISFFRFESQDSFGTANPLLGQGGQLPVGTLAYGHSQSGRALNTMIWQGLHVDEQGRMVFDGVFIDGAGSGKGSFNFRFAQTSRHMSPDIELDHPTDFFPFSTVEQIDPVTEERGSLLDQARRLNAVPRIFIINTATEYWARSASLLHTDTEGTTDVMPDPSVRLYAVAGAQHGIGTAAERGSFVHCRNPLDHRPVLRALISHLDAWVTLDRAPPPSRYPHISDGTLVAAETYQSTFPDAAFMRTPIGPLRPPRLDHGPRFASDGIADQVPPEQGEPYKTLVLSPNEDGQDMAGIRLPDLKVPLGTYTGWNPQNAETGAPARLGRWFGSFIPYARTVPERQARNDPRAAITERYISKDEYVSAFAEATLSLAGDELILGFDINPMIERAGLFYDAVLSHSVTDESCGYTRIAQ